MESGAEYDRRLMSLIAAARDAPDDARDALLNSLRDEEPQLFGDVVEALTWEHRMGDFLQRPMMSFLTAAQPFQSGQVIATRFEIVRQIGAGGMGVVYEAYDRRRRQRIAIKSAKPGFQTLLSPELEGALKVRHPNICLVNEIHTASTEHGDVDFLTMELLEGETLASHLSRRERLPRDEATRIARQLCAGLAEAHRSGILHRDLKAANIILCRAETADVRAVITDFGLAGGLAAESEQIAGTPDYMAPELWQGAGTSRASDIYALGVILCEMISGRRQLSAHIDSRWARVIRQCLDPSPDARPQDAMQVLRALEGPRVSTVAVLASALVLAVLGAIVTQVRPVHDWLADHLWPEPPSIRLAVLPLDDQAGDPSLPLGVLQDVSDRVAQLRSGRHAVLVIRPHEALRSSVRTPAQAKLVLRATHALKTSLQREGDEIVASASIIDLSTQVNSGALTARYSPATVGNLPAALAGAVSLALRLSGDISLRALSAAATVPYDQGLYYLRNDDRGFVSAIPLFEAAARLDPGSPLPLAALAEARVLEFKQTTDGASLAHAHRALRAAESLSPDSVAVRLASGMLHEAEGEYEKARVDYERVRELEPRNLESYLRTAQIYEQLDMAEQAVDAYRRAIELQPNYYKPYHDFGVFYYYRAKYHEAAAQFRKSIELAPGRIEDYTNLAAAYSDLGDDAQAERALVASLKIQETANARNSLGAIRAYQKKDADALAQYRRAVQLDATDYVYWLNLGDSARRLALASEATEAYESAVNLARSELAQNPRRGLVRAYVAYFAARLGQRSIAEDYIQESLKFSPGDSKVVRRAVLTYEALGERGKAVDVLDQAGLELLRELDRHPDLAEFSRDVRFRQLLSRTSPGGN